MDKKEYEKRKYLQSEQARIDILQPSEGKFKLYYKDQYSKMEDRAEAGEKQGVQDRAEKDAYLRKSRDKGEGMRVLNAYEKFERNLNG
ncbi:MAG TPA: hypothetical protein ENI13_00920 [candidate division CPR3 bacterium]|uniref:Uncharacterized protein n=1 Tax=candidate division CPR3 bacterium TaxID=2268181 RepID=A0A7C1T7E4_UNCC3|nr:hypothetical protein [candidate division CPR3 bacterium]